MSVFRSNIVSTGSVLPESVIRQHSTTRAAIGRDRMAQKRAAEAAAEKLALIERYQAVLAAKAANNGIPPALAERLADPTITPYERLQVEQTIASIVRAERRSVALAGMIERT